MNKTSDKFRDQSRWDQKGKDLIEEIQDNPGNFIVDGSCYLPSGPNSSPFPAHQALVKAIGDLKGKKVLDLGCGRGKFRASNKMRYI